MVNRVPGATPRLPVEPQRVKTKPSATGPRFELGRTEAARATVKPQPTDPVSGSVTRLIANLEHQRHEIDRVIQQAARGRNFSPAELLVLQSRVYSYSQEMEVVSRMVDRAVSVVKTTLNTQV